MGGGGAWLAVGHNHKLASPVRCSKREKGGGGVLCHGPLEILLGPWRTCKDTRRCFCRKCPPGNIRKGLAIIRGPSFLGAEKRGLGLPRRVQAGMGESPPPPPFDQPHAHVHASNSSRVPRLISAPPPPAAGGGGAPTPQLSR